jgi:DNA-binding SARP family transcriptional activator
VYLLGRFEVVRDDAPIPAHAWRRRRPADLLKLVALAPRRSLARERVVETLWPEKDAASGANNLHRALYDLRQILGGRFVDIEQGEVSLRADVWLDVDAFEAAIQKGDRASLAAAAGLYRGDLSPEHRDLAWLADRRALLRARFVQAALPLARAAAGEGDARTAIPLLRRVVAAGPPEEEPQLLLVRALAAAGRRAEALRQLDAAESSLRGAGFAPSDALAALRGAVQRGEVGAPTSRPPADGAQRAARRLLGAGELPPVRGRGPLLLLLEALAEHGSGAVVLLGEPGVGKTRLAVEGARIAQTHGAAVLCAVGGTRPGAPYALFADLLREEAGANPALPDPFAAAGDGGASGERVRRAISDGVVAAIRVAAEGRPPLLVLDDLHLADESSLNLLHELLRRARELSLMAIATVSEDAIHAGIPIQAALAHLDAARLARGVRVPRLPLAGTREQVADLLQGPAPEASVAAIHRLTDGAPHLVEEIVRAQVGPGPPLPQEPAAAMRARVARLGSAAGALLGAAAVAGRRFELDLVRRVSGLGPREAAAALDACVEARVLDDDGAGYRFHHEALRAALYAGLGPERRTALHGELADALEVAAADQDPPFELVALHRRLAGQQDRALRPLLAAGHRAAARGGHREALAFYAAALALAERAGATAEADRRELLEACGRAQLALGEIDAAVWSLERAADAQLEEAPAADAARARLHHLEALALASAGRLDEAHRAIARGSAAAERAGGDGLAPLLELTAALRWHEGTTAGAPAEAAPADEPGASGEAERELPVDVHLLLWDRDLLDGGVAGVEHAAGLLEARGRARGAAELVSSAKLGLGAAALAGADLELAEGAFRAALQGHREAGSALGEALSLERLAALLTARGRLAEALDAVDEGIVVAERAVLREHALLRLHTTAARNRLAAGALHAAEDAIRQASEVAARHGSCVACDAAFRPETVRVLLARGRPDDAEREAVELDAIAARHGCPVLGARAVLARARVLAASGLAPDALAALAIACEAFLDAGHRYDAARCARLELRLHGPGADVPEEVRALSALVTVDPDA